MRLRLEAIRRVAARIHTFEFVDEDGAMLPAATAGAHVSIALPNGLTRQYSLVHTGDTLDRYLIAVKRDEHSRGGSAWLFDHARVGMAFEIDTPRNQFGLDEHARASLLIAGGIGITPMVAMAERLAGLGSDWQLVHAVRRADEAAFSPELRERFPGRVSLHIDALAGGPLDLAALIAPWASDAALYCCGPAPMLDRFEALGKARPAQCLHVERFSAAIENAQTGGFELELARSGRVVAVTPGQTIAQALSLAGVEVRVACEQGVCGTCETRVLAGTPDHRDMLLTDAEKASNAVMMICCSGSLSQRLVLDL